MTASQWKHYDQPYPKSISSEQQDLYQEIIRMQTILNVEKMNIPMGTYLLFFLLCKLNFSFALLLGQLRAEHVIVWTCNRSNCPGFLWFLRLVVVGCWYFQILGFFVNWREILKTLEVQLTRRKRTALRNQVQCLLLQEYLTWFAELSEIITEKPTCIAQDLTIFVKSSWHLAGYSPSGYIFISFF